MRHFNDQYNKLNETISAYSRTKIIIRSYLFIIAIWIIYGILQLHYPALDQTDISLTNSVWYKNTLTRFVIIVIIGPLIETLIYHYSIYHLIKNTPLTEARSKTIIIVSSLLFALSHFYNVSFILYAFLIGILFMLVYINRIKKGDAFVIVYIIHAIFNLTLFTVNFIIIPHFLP